MSNNNSFHQNLEVEHLHQKVFERFEKGDTDKEGCGVGLAMVKSLVELARSAMDYNNLSKILDTRQRTSPTLRVVTLKISSSNASY